MLVCMTSAAGKDIWFSNRQLGKLSAIVRAFAIQLFTLPVVAAVLLIVGLPEVDPSFWKWFAIDVVLMIAAQVWYMRALSLGALSQTQSILALTPAMMLLTDPFLTGDSIPFWGWVGVIVTALGVYASQHPGGSIRDGAFKWFIAPFKEMVTQPGVRVKLGVAVIYTITSSLDKLCTEASNPPFYLTIESAFLACSIGIMALIQRRRAGTARETITMEDKKALAIGGAINANTTLFQFWALTMVPAPFVIAVKRFSIVLTSSWSFFIRKDHEFNWWRGIGILMAVGGIVIIVLT